MAKHWYIPIETPHWLSFKVQRCSMRTRTFYVELLTRVIMNCEKLGYLTADGQPFDCKAFAKCLHIRTHSAYGMLTELLKNDVIREDEKGALYCPETKHRLELSHIRTEAGKKGGNPILHKQKDNQLDKPYNRIEKKKRKESKSPSPEYFEFAKELQARVVARQPKCRERRANLKKWAEEVEKLVTKDEHSLEEARGLIKWCYEEEIKQFWWKNIRSPSGLRRNWDGASADRQSQIFSKASYRDIEQEIFEARAADGARQVAELKKGEKK